MGGANAISESCGEKLSSAPPTSVSEVTVAESSRNRRRFMGLCMGFLPPWDLLPSQILLHHCIIVISLLVQYFSLLQQWYSVYKIQNTLCTGKSQWDETRKYIRWADFHLFVIIPVSFVAQGINTREIESKSWQICTNLCRLMKKSWVHFFKGNRLFCAFVSICQNRPKIMWKICRERCWQKFCLLSLLC